MPTYEGACCCGEVKYRLTSRPMFVNCCHCTDCQRHTGSAFAINAIIETDRIELVAGKPEPVSMPTESGRPHDIYRCPTCRVALWSDYGRRPKMRFVRVATLNPPHDLAPQAHIFVRSKPPWLELPTRAPTFDVFYELEKTWPAESQARLAEIRKPG
jgi:hypothetical protein